MVNKVKHLITIDDFYEEIETIFAMADEFCDKYELWDENKESIRGRIERCNNYILASLFFEPSTRTRFSFETAMQRLGGGVITATEPGSTSISKGESIADMVRVVGKYADIIVIRHPWEGAPRFATKYAEVPIINAGDGAHEHPTQTLCDLYTLYREFRGDSKNSLSKAIKGKTILICGDLKHGRTVHSLVYALANFGANIIAYSAPGLELQSHVIRRLESDYECLVRSFDEKNLAVDAVYVTPSKKPHQLSIFTEAEIKIQITFRKAAKEIDALYVTRLQKERLPQAAKWNGKAYPVINRRFLSTKRYKSARILHPLPRVDELSYDIDKDERGIYFKQAAYGVAVRMALLCYLLELKKGSEYSQRNQLTEDEIFSHKRYPLYSKNPKCPNQTCVSNHENKAKPTYWVISERPLRLRCVYCEWEIEKSTRTSSYKTPELKENIKGAIESKKS